MKRKLLLATLCVVGALGFKAHAQAWTTGSEVAEGEYYLYNVSADRYLNNGSSWVTHSILDGQGAVLTISIQDGKYRLYSGVSGGAGPYVWGDWMNNDAGTNGWYFNKVDYPGYTNVYTLQQSDNTGTYLYWNGGVSGAFGNEVYGSGESVNANSYWMLIPKATRQTLSNATIENPLDVTYLINDPDFEKRVSNDNNSTAKAGSGQTSTFWTCGGFWRQYSQQTFANGIFFEKYASGGLTTADAIYQSPELAVGTYCLSATVYSSCSQAYLYAGDDEETQVSAAGKYSVYFTVSEAKAVQVGMKIKASGTGNWVAFDNVRLYYYGNVTKAEVMLADKIKEYQDALAAAQDYQDDDMFTADKTSLNTVVTNNTLDLSGDITEEQLTAATNNLNAATIAAEKAVAKYTAYNNVVAAVEGKTNVDITSSFSYANLGFEEGNLNSWTSSDGGNVASNNNWSKKVGTWFVERWRDKANNAGLSDGSLIHEVITLPAGVYTFTVNAQNIEQYNSDAAGTGYFFCVNDEQKEIGASNTYSLTAKFTAETNDVTIKFLLDQCTGNWISCDNVAITYDGADFPAVSLVEGKMNADVSTAQTAAKNAYDENGTVANYNALVDAVTAAQASKDAYAAAATAIANAEDIQTNHTFASSTAVTTFAEAIAAIKTPYTNNTLTTEDANGAGSALGSIVTNWRAAANSAAVAYLNDGFSLNDFDADLYVNTWSNEGESDGSNFKVPFYEYFAGEGSALGENTWTGTLSGLENGLYSVSAWVRVRSMNADTDAADLVGISMNVNGGTSVDVTEGNVISVQEGNARFQHKVYTAEGLVKDGTLNVNFVIANNNNIHWLSFKNITYTKERDLNPEEMATAPTAIALKNGEDVVTEAIALDATTSTVTLTPSYTPADATDGYIAWTSSDETVATVAAGVVTAVSTGTATITATSTLDGNVSASATVNVSFPESTVPAYVNSGATRTVYNFGPNLIKNGSFEYSDNFYGWTSGTGAKLTSSNFSIQTSGAYDGSNYLKASLDKGQADAGSIYTSWPVEAGKKYVFCYQMKNSSAVSNDGYIRTSLSATTSEDEASYNETFKAVSFGTDWTELSYEFTVPEGKNYLVFSARWLKSSKSFDNFYLCEVLSDPTTEGNVDYATDAIPTANIGTGAFQYSQDAIDDANALVQGTATVEDVENAYEALTTLNAPAADKTYNIVNVSASYNHSGKAVTFKSASNADLSANTTSMGWTEDPGSIYPQAVKFTAVDGKANVYKLSYTRADDNVVYVSTNKKAFDTGDNNQIRPTTDASKALEVRVEASTTDNVWYLWNTETSKRLGANGANDQGLFTGEANGYSYYSMKIQEAVNNEVSLSIDAANQYGTIILPFDAEVPAGVTAYSVSEVEGSTLTLVEEDAFVANTPYIVYAENGANETLAGLGSAYTDATYTEGLLTGTYTNATEVPASSYVLLNQNDKVAFYQVETAGDATVNANHAYLTAPVQGAKAFYFNADDANGIEAISALTSGEFEGIYTIGGAKVNSLQKGINIVKMQNGETRKIFVK